MDDRIAEIREALTEIGKYHFQHADIDQHALARVFEAARAYVDLLDSDALIIRRDENGEWPLEVVMALGRGVFDAETASVNGSVSPAARRHRFAWEQLVLAGLDALASSQGVEP